LNSENEIKNRWYCNISKQHLDLVHRAVHEELMSSKETTDSMNSVGMKRSREEDSDDSSVELLFNKMMKETNIFPTHSASYPVTPPTNRSISRFPPAPPPSLSLRAPLQEPISEFSYSDPFTGEKKRKNKWLKTVADIKEIDKLIQC
jgi:hypothetical protein